MNPRRRKRNRFHYRRRRRNWWPWIIFVAVAALFFWAVFQFFLVLFSNVRSESISVELGVERGRAEFLLPDNTDWNPAFSEQKFLEGDSIKTAKNSRISLEFLNENQIFLDSDTEIKIIELTQKSSGKTNAQFELVTGQIWAQINDANFNTDESSALSIITDRSQILVRGTTFNLKRTTDNDQLTLIDGQVDVVVLGADDKSQNVNVGVGQSLVVNEGTYDLLARNGDPISAVDSAFEESDWYIDNLERQSPEKAAAIREKIAPPATDSEGSQLTSEDFFDSLELDSDMEAPTITTPVQGERISADEDLLPIKGTAPLEAFQIQVNDYVLQRFEPGDRAWTYIAATEYGTLRPGENTYNVVAITRNGKRSEIATIDVFYEGTIAAPKPTPVSPIVETDTEEVLADDPAPVTVLSDLPAPVVTRPALFAADPTAVYETSASVVTFAGEVAPGTQAVEVNGFRLRKFSTGDTDFSYIANANYGNMKEGENVYVIKAFGADNTFSQTQITIFYRAVSLD